MMRDDIWSGMSDVADRLLLKDVKPNMTLVGEALSFDASRLTSISDEKLRQYLVVLGQYLITIQYEENKAEAICSAWQKVLDTQVYKSIYSMPDSLFPNKKATLAEKRAWVLGNDQKAKGLYDEYQKADAQKCIIKNISKPVDQYINTIKKEIDARENEKKRTGY